MSLIILKDLDMLTYLNTYIQFRISLLYLLEITKVLLKNSLGEVDHPI